MRAGHRSYSDAVSWLTSTEAPRTRSTRLAVRLLDGSVVAGVLVLGTIGLASPASFGSPGAAPFRSGWPWLLLLGLVGTSVAVFAIRWKIVTSALRDFGRKTDATDQALRKPSLRSQKPQRPCGLDSQQRGSSSRESSS